MPLYSPSSSTATRQWPWQPSDNGWLAANFDPLYTDSTGDSFPAGQVVWSKVWLPSSVTIANLLVVVTVTATTYTASQNFGVLYSSTGTLLAKTADQSTLWTSTGMKPMPLIAEAGQSLTQGGTGVYVHAGVLWNGTGTARFGRARPQAVANIGNTGLATLTHRFADGPTAQTTPPASIGSTTSSAVTLWVALS